MVDDLEDLNIELADLLINTTSIGMKDTDPLLVDPEALHKDMLVYDVIYNPKGNQIDWPKHVLAQTGTVCQWFRHAFLSSVGVWLFWHWSDVELDEAD